MLIPPTHSLSPHHPPHPPYSPHPPPGIEYAADEVEAAEQVEYKREEEEDPVALAKALRFAYAWAWVLTGLLIFLIPLPMMGEWVGGGRV